MEPRANRQAPSSARAAPGCIWCCGLLAAARRLPLVRNVAESVLGNTSIRTRQNALKTIISMGKPLPELYSVQAIGRGSLQAAPCAAVAYRLARSPILWLGSQYPFSLAMIRPDPGLVPWILFLAGGFLHRPKSEVAARFPRSLYLFVLLLLCASPLIHSEFRYSFPVWNTLVLTPGLLLATLSPNGWRHNGTIHGSTT